MRTSRMLAFFFVMACFAPLAHSADDSKLVFIHTDSGYIPCWRLSDNFVMQDQGFCGRAPNKNFCMAPVECRWGNNQGNSVAMVACRARWTSKVPGDEIAPGSGSLGGHPTCPRLQDCADEPYQKLETEEEASREKDLPGDVFAETPAPPAPASDAHADSLAK